MSRPRERLVRLVHELERLEEAKKAASDALRDAFDTARATGFDPHTLKVVLRLRKMTPAERREKRALEAIYMAALGMLEGDALPEEARRRLDEDRNPPAQRKEAPGPGPKPVQPADQKAAPRVTQDQKPKAPPQQTLALKDPEEARKEGKAAAAAGKRIYDNPFPAGDPCRAAWDEGWCAENKSHGMETPAAYQRRSTKPPDKDGSGDKDKGAA